VYVLLYSYKRIYIDALIERVYTHNCLIRSRTVHSTRHTRNTHTAQVPSLTRPCIHHIVHGDRRYTLMITHFWSSNYLLQISNLRSLIFRRSGATAKLNRNWLYAQSVILYSVRYIFIILNWDHLYIIHIESFRVCARKEYSNISQAISYSRRFLCFRVHS
jgi:hypothetical protein